MTIYLAFITTILSGLLGVIITILFNIYKDNRQQKMTILWALLAFRNDVANPAFISNLNAVFVVYHKDKKVINALLDFHNNTQLKQKNSDLSNDKLVLLLKEMCKANKIKLDSIADSFILKPFEVPRNQLNIPPEEIERMLKNYSK